MHAEHETPPATGRPPRAPQEELADLRFTWEICRRALPWDAQPEQYDRLRRIAGMVWWSLERR